MHMVDAAARAAAAAKGLVAWMFAALDVAVFGEAALKYWGLRTHHGALLRYGKSNHIKVLFNPQRLLLLMLRMKLNYERRTQSAAGKRMYIM
jgi:hypothetical protein